jgi:hypothetical protein
MRDQIRVENQKRKCVIPNSRSTEETIAWFSAQVAKRFDGIRVVPVGSPDGSIVRYLVAPADRFKDELLPAQKARQEQAGAMPPEIYGHDLFELVRGNVVRLRDGSRIAIDSERALRTVLDRFLQSNSFDNRLLVTLVERIREGQAAARKANSSLGYDNQ